MNLIDPEAWDLGEKITATVVAVGSIGWATWRIIVPTSRKMKRFVQAVRSIAPMQQLQQQQTELLQEIRSELRPNGGSSLRDRIDGIQRSVEYNGRVTRKLMTSNSNGFIEFDPGGNVKTVSRGMTRRLGRTEGELTGRNWMACLHPLSRGRADAEIENALKNKRDIEMLVEFVHPESNTTIPTRINAYAVIDHVRQTVDGWLGDVTFPQFMKKDRP